MVDFTTKYSGSNLKYTKCFNTTHLDINLSERVVGYSEKNKRIIYEMEQNYDLHHLIHRKICYISMLMPIRCCV